MRYEGKRLVSALNTGFNSIMSEIRDFCVANRVCSGKNVKNKNGLPAIDNSCVVYTYLRFSRKGLHCAAVRVRSRTQQTIRVWRNHSINQIQSFHQKNYGCDLEMIDVKIGTMHDIKLQIEMPKKEMTRVCQPAMSDTC